MELVVATKNKKKLKEIKDLLVGMRLKITSLADYSDAPRIVENGKTFRENAVKKAITTARFRKTLTLGEDSGLCVNALGGAPGVYSSRFSGKDKSDLKNNLKLLDSLKGLPLSQRRAHYVCAVALADKDGLIGVVEGKCYGLIGFQMRGEAGFGYDPLFIIPRYKKTFAQLGLAIKHKMSHRRRALSKARGLIAVYLIPRRKSPGFGSTSSGSRSSPFALSKRSASKGSPSLKPSRAKSRERPGMNGDLVREGGSLKAF